jgi:hypothetical protein
MINIDNYKKSNTIKKNKNKTLKKLNKPNKNKKINKKKEFLFKKKYASTKSSS